MKPKKMTQEEKMAACFKPHTLIHSIFGLGVGLLVASLVPSLVQGAGLPLAVVFLVIGFCGHYLLKAEHY